MSTSPTYSARDHIYRQDSTETSDSSGSSGLNTPVDEKMLHPIDVVSQGEIDEPATPKPPTIPHDTKQRSEDGVPRVRTLSRAVTKAKKIAQTLTRSSKVSKKTSPTSTENMLLPTRSSIRSYDIFYNMPNKLPNIERKVNDQDRQAKEDVPITSHPEDASSAPRESRLSLLNLSNTGTERTSLEVEDPSPREDSNKSGLKHFNVGNMGRKESSVNVDVDVPSLGENARSISLGLGQALLRLTNTGVERYSVEVNPSTSDDERDIEDDIDLPEAATMEDITIRLRSGTLPSEMLDCDVDNVQDDATLLPICDSMSMDTLEPSWEWPTLEITPRNILVLFMKIACFVPWCIAVGGTILVCPASLELVTFAPGYQSSPRGIHRFAYWANCAMQHVAIFMAFVGVLLWWNRPLGVVVLAGVVACAVHAWGDFVLNRNVPLGEDDRQAIYLVFAHYGIKEEPKDLVLKKTDAGYFALGPSQLPVNVSDADSMVKT